MKGLEGRESWGSERVRERGSGSGCEFKLARVGRARALRFKSGGYSALDIGAILGVVAP